MPVSGVGPSGFNYPAQPPQNGTPAFSLIAISRLAEMAESIKTSAESSLNAPASTTPLTLGPTAALYAELQALADLLRKITS